MSCLSSAEVQAAVRERQAMKNRQQLQQTLSAKQKHEGAEGKQRYACSVLCKHAGHRLCSCAG